jgi:hypothetical protein
LIEQEAELTCLVHRRMPVNGVERRRRLGPVFSRSFEIALVPTRKGVEQASQAVSIKR